MTTLLQVSDPHFGTERPEVVDALEALARRRRPDLLVLSGDITQRARRAQFAAAARFVERLGIPARLAIPGNHDIPLYDVFTRAFAPYRGFVREFGDDFAPVHGSADIAVDFGGAPGEIDVTVRQLSLAAGWGLPAARRFSLP